jgi:muconate/chloromuconate cycloisomerase
MKDELVVKSCRTYLVDLPLRRRHYMSFGAPDAVNFVMVKIETADGLVGWGEAATLGGPTWSEESSETIKVVIDRYIAPLLVGQNILEYQVTLQNIFSRLRGNRFAKAAVEFAVMDIVGKFYRQPVYNLLGGSYRDRVDLSWSLASGDLKNDIAEAKEKMEEGYRIFKLKFGVHPWQEDLERLRIARQELSDDVSLRVDVNQGWDRATAHKALIKMEPYSPAFFEQPLAKWDLEGMAALRGKTSIPILADESLESEQAALEMIRRQSADAFSFKLTKLGGLLNTHDVYFMTRTAGVAAYIGCMIESSVGTAVYLHFAATIPRLEFGCELFGPRLLKDDVVDNPIRIEDGKVFIPDGPGLGVKVNEDKIKQYQRDERTDTN